MKIKKLTENAIIPSHGSKQAAGWDLYSIEDVSIMPGRAYKVHTGVAMAVPIGYFGAIYPRSGLATKAGLRLCNGVGVVDSDYRNEVLVPLYNDSTEVQTIHKGDRIAQLIVQPYLPLYFEEVDELSYTKRGNGGFGSTGK